MHSEPLQALDQGGAVHLTVGKGVKSTAAGNAVEEAKSNWVKVPTLYSPALSDASAQVVDTDGGQGQRALVVGFSDAVKDKELARATKALAAAAARSERCRDRQRCRRLLSMDGRQRR